jgi:hypothetical protein
MALAEGSGAVEESFACALDRREVHQARIRRRSAAVRATRRLRYPIRCRGAEQVGIEFKIYRIFSAICLCSLGSVATAALGADYAAGPANYIDIVRTLKAGDTLSLVGGEYREGLTIHNLHGNPGHPIVIRGPRPRMPAKAVFIAGEGANTVSLAQASYITISNLWLDGHGADVDAVKAEGSEDPVHHITLQGLTIVGYGGSQQTVGISTKCPAWGWVIRGNIIIGAGTGMYLGNSDGRAPFVAGTIEKNVVIDSIGYDIQIKHQVPRPALIGIPSGPSVTTLRGNVFTKSRNASTGQAARPNVLLGAFPIAGNGHQDRYVVTYNILLDNPSERLFQGEGNLLLDLNVFLNLKGDAISLQPHHDRPRTVMISSNFVAAAGRGISMTGADRRSGQSAVGNVVYAEAPNVGIEDRGNALNAFPAPERALREWLRRHWNAQRGSELSATLTHACASVAAGAEVCELLHLIDARTLPRRTEAKGR